MSDEKLVQANQMVNNYVKGALGLGLIPAPVIDMVLISALQLKMINDLAKLYDQSITDNKTEAVTVSTIASIMPMSIKTNLFSLCKGVPIIGQGIGLFGMSALSGASTYALGKVFIEHFACGGTLLSLEPEKVKAYFKQQYQQGKQLVQTDSFAGVKP